MKNAFISYAFCFVALFTCAYMATVKVQYPIFKKENRSLKTLLHAWCQFKIKYKTKTQYCARVSNWLYYSV